MVIQLLLGGPVRFSKLIDQRVRKRKKPVNGSWRMDETYIKLNGKWVYLYRAVDSAEGTVDFLLKGLILLPFSRQTKDERRI